MHVGGCEWVFAACANSAPTLWAFQGQWFSVCASGDLTLMPWKWFSGQKFYICKFEMMSLSILYIYILVLSTNLMKRLKPTMNWIKCQAWHLVSMCHRTPLTPQSPLMSLIEIDTNVHLMIGHRSSSLWLILCSIVVSAASKDRCMDNRCCYIWHKHPRGWTQQFGRGIPLQVSNSSLSFSVVLSLCGCFELLLVSASLWSFMLLFKCIYVVCVVYCV